MNLLLDQGTFKLLFRSGLAALLLLLSGCFGSYTCEDINSLDAASQADLLSYFPQLSDCSSNITGIVIDGDTNVTVNGIVIDGTPVEGG